MKFLKDARIASLICAAVVLLSLPMGVYRSVKSEADKIQLMFHQGVDGSGYGIQGDYMDRRDDAFVLITIAEKYPDAEQERKALETVWNATTSPVLTAAEKYDADQSVQSGVLALNLRLQELALSKTDEEYRAQYMADFESRGITMNREAANYNAEVRAFEEKVLSGLPVRLFGWILPLPEVEAFQ